MLNLAPHELFSRLYRVSTIESDGRVTFTHLLVADAKNPQNKNEYIDKNIAKYKRVSHSSIYCLVEGEDFTISPAGEIMRIPQK